MSRQLILDTRSVSASVGSANLIGGYSSLGATRSEIKSPREFARIARLPLTLVKGETWVIPAERMKEGKEHHVPLTEEELGLVSDRKGRLFPGYAGQMMEVLNKLRPGYTVHDFRSSFADWAAEHDYPQNRTSLIAALRASTKGAK